MDILSLNERPPLPERRLSRAEAIGASMLLHVVVLLLFVRGVEGLPAPLARWLQAIALRPPVQEAARSPETPVPPDRSAAKTPQEKKDEKKPSIPPVPVKFAYVRIPDEAEFEKNPEARRFSDRDRKARQDRPSEEQPRSPDPHSVGNTRERVLPDPRLKQGRDEPDPPKPAPERAAKDQARGDATGPATSDDATGKTPEKDEGPGETMEEPADPTVADAGDPSRNPALADAAGRSPAGVPGRPSSQRPGGQAGGRSPVPDLREGSENKFRFDNPGWLAGESVDGTLSFDTKGLPWGEYARKILVIIRQNWIDRLPLAYRQGQRGVTCQHFTIHRDGAVSDIDVVRRSLVPPFDRAATDALRASNPLPPLPPAFDLEHEGVTICFWYNMYPVED